MRFVRFTTSSASETRTIARLFVRVLASVVPFPAACVCALTGELGAGKTTFVQGVARALGIRRFTTSPTFLLVRSYDVPRARAFGPRTLVHVDSWRIEADDLEHLGITDAMRDSTVLILVEWADRVRRVMPRDALWIDFKHAGQNKRIITFSIP